jgi:TPP-dependent pyruvate/acetoin dehydrogenase alpha subunit
MLTDWTKEGLQAFEEEIKQAFLNKEIRGPIHLSGGNEEQVIEIFKDVQVNDYICTTYRNHYHCLLKGMPPERLKQHILEGRSMYLCDIDYGILSSAIVGGMLPIAVGLAMGLQRLGSPDRVWCFVGDMAAETGAFLEATKYAGRHQLPITFVIENNSLSTNTLTQVVWGLSNMARNLMAGDYDTVHPYTIGIDYGADVKYYQYIREVPHVGAGEFVVFS